MSYIDRRRGSGPSANEGAQDETFGMSKGTTKIGFAVVVFAGSMLTAWVVKESRPPFTNPRIRAEAYRWPVGCQPKRYTWRDDISVKCKVDAYAIPIALTSAHGFDPGNKSFGQFHRVGNDAIAFACPFFLKTCRIRRIYYNVFEAPAPR